METPRPCWRWLLFCLGCHLHFHTRGRLAAFGLELLGWAVLPAWLGQGAKRGEGEAF